MITSWDASGNKYWQLCRKGFSLDTVLEAKVTFMGGIGNPNPIYFVHYSFLFNGNFSLSQDFFCFLTFGGVVIASIGN